MKNQPTLYGFFSRNYLNFIAKDNRYGSIYRTLTGKLVVCTEVGESPVPFSNHKDVHHHGVVFGWVRSATREDVESVLDAPYIEKIEDPASYY